MVWTSSLLSCDKSQSSLLEETPGEGIYATEFLLEDWSLGGVQRKPVPAFQEPTGLKLTYQSGIFWVACPELLQSFQGGIFFYPSKTRRVLQRSVQSANYVNTNAK